jgi:nucleosome assembly protein 1-like 1
MNSDIPDLNGLARQLAESSVADNLDAEGKASLASLKSIQDDHDKVYDEFEKERRALEEKYTALFNPLFAKRSDELRKGKIPQFWLTAFGNCEMIRENITDKDAAALRYLTDVTCKEVDTAEAEASPAGKAKLTAGSYTLYFKFDPNPFFENDVLTKSYIMEDGDDGELDHAVGCQIKWKPGKDMTTKLLKKKIRGGRGGAGKIITKKEPCDSFFNFFSPPSPPADGQEVDEDDLDALEEVVGADFELGDTLRNDIIARAVLYYLDEVEGDDEDEDGDEDDGDNENEDDSDDDVAHPPPVLPPAQNPEDCKQQ